MRSSGWGALRPVRPPRARPFLKWAGGKSQVYASLKQYIPPISPDGIYFEPFLGGGAVFFALAPKRAVLGDVSQPLITTYSALKADVRQVIECLRRRSPPKSEPEYYELRRELNRAIPGCAQATGIQRSRFAALFITINHTCYNGLYRVNRKGEFNVPYGFCISPFIYDQAQLELASEALRKSRAKLVADDYERILANAEKGDLAYLDPPYEPLSDTSSFTNYTSGGFNTGEQERLSRVVTDLVERGCRVVLSNSSSPRIIGLYKNFRTARVSVPRAINSVGSRRSAVEELVVIA